MECLETIVLERVRAQKPTHSTVNTVGLSFLSAQGGIIYSVRVSRCTADIFIEDICHLVGQYAHKELMAYRKRECMPEITVGRYMLCINTWID